MRNVEMIDVSVPDRPARAARADASEKYTALVEHRAHGRKLDQDAVDDVLTTLALAPEDLEAAADERREELRVERATLAKDEPRLRAERDKARDAFVGARDKLPKCTQCGHRETDALKDLKALWEKAKHAWAPAERALGELGSFHVPRELRDRETAARVAIHDAEAAMKDAQALLSAKKSQAEALAGAGGLEEERALQHLDEAQEDVTKAAAALAAAQKIAKDTAVAIGAALADALKIDTEPKGARQTRRKA